MNYKDYKIGIPINGIVILLKEQKVRLVPYTSDGLCDGCYFFSFDKYCCISDKFKLVPSCREYRVNNINIDNVIFKEEKTPPDFEIPCW